MTEAEQSLVSEILLRDFGETISNIGKTLIRKGACTSSQLCQELKLKRNLILKCCLVLCQHNCLGYFEHSKTGQTFYELQMERIIVRLRYPQFLLLTEQLGGILVKF